MLSKNKQPVEFKLLTKCNRQLLLAVAAFSLVAASSAASGPDTGGVLDLTPLAGALKQEGPLLAG